MNIIDKIKSFLRSPEPECLAHPTLGNLVSDAVGDDDDIWQSEVEFAPLGISIGLTVYAGPDGPSEKQSEFFEVFKSNYSRELEWVAEPIYKEFEGWFGKRPQGTILEDFDFVALGIPRDGNRNNQWFIAFDCQADPNKHMYTAEIRSGEVEWVSVDG